MTSNGNVQRHLMNTGVTSDNLCDYMIEIQELELLRISITPIIALISINIIMYIV